MEKSSLFHFFSFILVLGQFPLPIPCRNLGFHFTHLAGHMEYATDRTDGLQNFNKSCKRELFPPLNYGC